MRKLIIIVFVVLLGCTAVPKNFTYFHQDGHKVYSGIDSLIDINGYYVSQHGCDTTFYSVFMFYDNGAFTIATTSEILPELVRCFEFGGKSIICKYPLWGEYRIVGDTIKTQTIRPEGGGCVIFRDYKILPNKQIVNISDYVDSRYTKLGYMKNYPSFKDNECNVAASFFPLDNKRDWSESSSLK